MKITAMLILLLSACMQFAQTPAPTAAPQANSAPQADVPPQLKQAQQLNREGKQTEVPCHPHANAGQRSQ